MPMLFELYCFVPIWFIGFVREWPMGEVDEEDWLRIIMAFKRGCSFEGFEDDVNPYPRA